jgi:putative membrane protein
MYEWLKVGHVLSIIAWMAALLYLPQTVCVPRRRRARVGDSLQTFKIMERRLYKAIMTPAMLASWAFGLGMICIWPGFCRPGRSGFTPSLLTRDLVMTGFHGFLRPLAPWPSPRIATRSFGHGSFVS